MALPYDFYIGGQGWNLAISEKHPYERATAQFRKDQFDTTATVGDQSLTGWWTRGQLSFHKGAGVTYYEVTNGETVFERYNDSNAIDVGTAGKASLIPALGNLGVAATDAVPAPLKSGGGVYALTGTGVQYTSGVSASAIATSDAGVPSSITSSGALYYVANAGKIEKQFDSTSVRTNHVTNPSFEADTVGWSGSGSTLTRTNYVTNPSFEVDTTGWTPSGNVVRTNLVTNPSFETGVAGWTQRGVGITSFDTGSGAPAVGAAYGRIESNGTRQQIWIDSDFITVTAGSNYAVQMQWRAAGTNAGRNNVYPEIDVLWYDASNNLLSTTINPGAVPTLNTWGAVSGLVAAPASAVKAKLRLMAIAPADNTIVSGNRYNFDAVQFEQADEVYGYFDGSTANATGITYAWTGAVGGSTSTATYVTSVTSSATQAATGTKSMKIDNPWTPNRRSATATITGLTPGTSYRVIASIFNTGSAPVALTVDSTVVDSNSTPNAWRQLTGLFTATAASHTVTIGHTASGGTPGAVYVDGVCWTEAPWDLGYFDGAKPANGTLTFAWTGTAHASTSTATDTSTASLVSSGVQFKYGQKSMRVGDKYGRLTPITTQVTLSGLTIGTTYQVAAYVRVDPGSTRNVAMSVDSAPAIATSSTTNAWERLSGTFAATATSHVLKFGHVGTGNAPPFYVDAVLWTETPYFGDYFDGSQSGASWVGTPNASKSTYTGAGSAASTVLWQNTSNNWSRVWWAKGRLWAVDTAGYWYTLSAAGGTVTSTNAFWNSQQTGASWSLAEGTGPVYISDGFNIYAITVSTDGLVPTVSTPTTVATIPLGEQVSTIGYYLGYLVIATSRGVRVAQVQSDGSLAMGPLVIKGDFSNANRVGTYDTHAYVVGRPSGRSGSAALCEINLGYFVSELIPAWSVYTTLSTTAPTKGGVTVAADGRIYVWANSDLKATTPDTLAASGYLLTGSHRFGTLDPKMYRFVRVRSEGSAGSIAVSVVLPDGTEHSVGTVLAGQSSDLDLSTAAPAPVEYLALKFTLTSDGTSGPTLLGYQLKALPVPKRQRMIRVPLMLFDGERNRAGQAMLTDPWSRLAALESLEESSSVVTYQDKESGESGSAYIEAVEVSRTSPPGPGNGSVGGYVIVTLRALR